MKKRGSPGVVGELRKEGPAQRVTLKEYWRGKESASLREIETVRKRQRDAHQSRQRAGGLCGFGFGCGEVRDEDRTGYQCSRRCQVCAQIWLWALREVGDGPTASEALP